MKTIAGWNADDADFADQRGFFSEGTPSEDNLRIFRRLL